MDVGEGFYGFSATIIQFDLGDDLHNISAMNLKLDIIVFGQTTRKIKIDIIQGDWDEYSYSTLNDYLNITDLAFQNSDDADYVKAITPDNDVLELSLSNHLELTGKINIVISGEIGNNDWISIYSKESSFLNPELTIEFAANSGEFASAGIFLLIIIVGFAIWFLKTRNSNTQKKKHGLNQGYVINTSGYNNMTPKTCRICGNSVDNSSYCSNCGEKVL